MGRCDNLPDQRNKTIKRKQAIKGVEDCDSTTKRLVGALSEEKRIIHENLTVVEDLEISAETEEWAIWTYCQKQ